MLENGCSYSILNHKRISYKICFISQGVDNTEDAFHKSRDKGHTGIPGLWTQVLDAGLWTLDSGLWTLDSGRWTLDSGLWMLDPRRWTLDAGFWMLTKQQNFKFELVQALETMKILILYSWILHWWKYLVTAGMKIHLWLTYFRVMFSSSKSIGKPEVFRNFQYVQHVLGLPR